jgi:hypothetical protein
LEGEVADVVTHLLVLKLDCTKEHHYNVGSTEIQQHIPEAEEM